MSSVCAVFGCSNAKGKITGSGIRYFRLSREELYWKIWLTLCRRADAVNPEHVIICSIYFTHCQSEEQRLLKKDTVPSLHLHNGKLSFN